MKKAALVPTGWGIFGLGLDRMPAVVAEHLAQGGWEVSVFAQRPLDLERIRQRFGVVLEGVGVRVHPAAAGGRRGKLRRILGDRIRRLAFSAGTREFDLLWVQSPYIPPFSLARRSILHTDFPFDAHPRAMFWRRRLRTCYRIVAISEFTRHWIGRYWDLDATVLYPPIHEFSPAEKMPWILAVGRFCSGARDKRQLELVRAFKGMCDEGLRDWVLHLAGIVEDRTYLAAVQAESEGYPVEYHLDVDFAQLGRLYAQSSIFWHAAGMGIDPELEPHRLEHFGIVTAEAMTAGCVPVAIGLGGQPEIVTGEGDGFLWHSLGELVRRTRTLVEDPLLRQRMGRRAREGAVARFGRRAFTARLEAVLAD
ncbi:MAG: glycosyltransferase family 4 protein [bacterium]|nr:glycosyltransferase family 4 protein [bacterium]